MAAHDLGSIAIQEALKRAGVKGEDVSEVIIGQVLTAGEFVEFSLHMTLPGRQSTCKNNKFTCKSVAEFHMMKIKIKADQLYFAESVYLFVLFLFNWF